MLTESILCPTHLSESANMRVVRMLTHECKAKYVINYKQTSREYSVYVTLTGRLLVSA